MFEPATKSLAQTLTDMIQVSAYPTVEWLKTRATDRTPIAPRPNRLRSLSVSSVLASRLREVLSDTVQIERNVWVATPEGELEVGVVIQKGNRRIAICETPRYRLKSDLSDALILVYGGFDSLYRLHSDQSVEALHDTVYALMCDLPTWFSNFGRMSAGRAATSNAIFAGNQDRLAFGDSFKTSRVRLDRMRLCVATDWVEMFEKALGAGQRPSAA
ncbi:MAG: hypothetical protein HOC28_04995 [Bacteroidetes Order II. Incertae sedis bacterium]|jgi:hypothetical protein|nr:hypothetical protein [Bacteroidetes Order II. bacterium]MBT4602467.1 hypothetical protein [Bacteroidetes Order II. bacterium]MBT5248811.1 hypothetical protein [Bacteroidetes Order II. bacterium]MBT6200120.1 hypothetical protein [Bacteroidetes Order II. bacterium]